MLEFTVSDRPPWHITLVYAVQQIMSTIGASISVIYVVHSAVCTEGHPESGLLFAEMLNATLFMKGLSTLLQTTFGIRLPVIQGSNGAFIAPIIAMMSTEQFTCVISNEDIRSGHRDMGNASFSGDDSKPWSTRLEVIAGSLMAASCLQFFLGITGLLGFIMNFIGPMTIIPTVSLIGFSIFEQATRAAQHQWGICALTVGLIVVFAVLLGDVKVPLPMFSRKKKCSVGRFSVFRLFPHVSAVAIAWTLSYILTATDVFHPSTKNETNFARTDAKPGIMEQAEWFLLPYPGRISGIAFNSGVFAGMCAAVLASIIESVGNYYATAHICQEPLPPKHAVNRGMLIEGINCLLAGSLGIGHSTTTFSTAIGFIALTKMAARWVWQMTGLLLMILGMFGKFGAALTIIPDPIIGGLMVVSIGMIISVGLSNVSHIDTQSSRNLLILAIAFMFGLMMPMYMRENPDIIDTGNVDVDQILSVMLSTGMLVGGILAFLLDNILPGTQEERGMVSFHRMSSQDENDVEKTDNANSTDIYDLPYITPLLNRVDCFAYVPFMPNYRQDKFSCCRKSNDMEKGSLDSKIKNIDDTEL